MRLGRRVRADEGGGGTGVHAGEGRGVMRVAGCQGAGTPHHMPGGT